jgi:hypothetical protein
MVLELLRSSAECFRNLEYQNSLAILKEAQKQIFKQKRDKLGTFEKSLELRIKHNISVVEFNIFQTQQSIPAYNEWILTFGKLKEFALECELNHFIALYNISVLNFYQSNINKVCETLWQLLEYDYLPNPMKIKSQLLLFNSYIHLKSDLCLESLKDIQSNLKSNPTILFKTPSINSSFIELLYQEIQMIDKSFTQQLELKTIDPNAMNLNLEFLNFYINFMNARKYTQQIVQNSSAIIDTLICTDHLEKVQTGLVSLDCFVKNYYYYLFYHNLGILNSRIDCVVAAQVYLIKAREYERMLESANYCVHLLNK